MQFVIGILLLFSSVLSLAQQSLTFKEAIKIALDENVTLKNQYNQLQTVQAQLLTNKAQYLPSLSITGQGNRTDGQQINSITGEGQNITSDFFRAGFNASMPIFNGMRRISNVKRASYDLKAQQQNIIRQRQQVIVNVANQFLQVLLNQELLKIAEQNLQTQQKLLEQIKNFKEVGTRPITDVYTQEAQMRNVEVQVLRARNTLRNDQSQLAQILQIEPIADLSLAYPVWDVNQISLADVQLETLYETALASRPDLAQINNQEKSLKYQVKSATSGYLPTINLQANYGSRYFATKGKDNTASFSDQFFDLNPTLRYGFTFSIPLFDRFAARNSRINAKMRHKSVSNNTENLKKTIKIDVQRAYQNFSNAITSYQATQVQLKAAELALQTQQESYQLGASDQIDLARSNQLYVQAEASNAQAKLTLLFQKIILDFNVGTLKVEDIP